MKRISAVAFAAVCSVVLSLTPALAQGKKQLALVTNAAADFWTIAKRGVEKAQKELPDYSMEVVITGQGWTTLPQACGARLIARTPGPRECAPAGGRVPAPGRCRLT